MPRILCNACDVSVFKPLKSEWQATVREWQMCEENTNQTLTKSKFCPLLKKVLEKQNLPQTIKNGFRKCGLYPFSPDAVDYTKCVQNVLEKLEHTNQIVSTDSGLPDVRSYEIAEKNIKSIQQNLEDRGVNVNILFDELFKLKKSLSNQRDDNVSVPPANASDDVSPLPLFSNGMLHDVDDSGYLVPAAEEIQENRQSLEVDSISPKLSPEATDVVPDIASTSKVQILNVVTIPPNSTDISTVLFYPKPIPKSKKNKTAPKMPSAVSSEMWRQLEREKEDAKKRNIEAVQKRKEEMKKKKEAKQAEMQRKKAARKQK